MKLLLIVIMFVRSSNVLRRIINGREEGIKYNIFGTTLNYSWERHHGQVLRP
jgi:hypothetical protein